MVEEKHINKIIGDYIADKILGQGGFGKCYRVKHKSNQEYLAMKVMKVKAEEKERIKSELGILKQLDNPMMIKYRDSFEIKKKLYVIMELASGGTLGDLIEARSKEKRPFNIKEIMKILDQLVFGLKYLNDENIVHRDLKPLNIFLTEDLFVKYGDFGLASQLMENEYTFIDIGSINYVAPEILKHESSKLEPDIWALGCILYEIITLQKCFTGNNQLTIMNKIANGEYEKELLIGDNCPESLANFVCSLLIVDRKLRPDIYTIYAHLLKLQAEFKGIQINFPSKEEETKGQEYVKEKTLQATYKSEDKTVKAIYKPDHIINIEDKTIQAIYIPDYLTTYKEYVEKFLLENLGAKEIISKYKRFDINTDKMIISQELELKNTVFINNEKYYIGFWNKVSNKREGLGFSYKPEEFYFEGFLKEDKINGLGVVISMKNKLFIYEGMFEEGLPHGVGKSIGTDYIYEGEHKKGMRNGKGLLKMSSGIQYEGETKDNKKHGYGILTLVNGNSYEGEWLEGKKHGRGIWGEVDCPRREGMWKEGERIKWLTEEEKTMKSGKKGDDNMERYLKLVESYILANPQTEEMLKMHKKRFDIINIYIPPQLELRSLFITEKRATYTGFWKGELCVEGFFKDDKLEGKAMVLYYNGNLFEGMFKDGVTHGKGKFIGHEGNSYEGNYVQGKRNGMALLKTKAGLYYEGWITDGKKNGAGTCKLANGDILEGVWVDNKLEGIVFMTIANTGERKQSLYKEGKLLPNK